MTIELTESARAQVAKLVAETAKEGQQLRFFIEKGGCSGLEYGMRFDFPQSDDIRIQQGTVEVLLDPSALEYLNGAVVDFDDGLHGKGFEIRNPNAATTCGCGRSFN